MPRFSIVANDGLLRQVRDPKRTKIRPHGQQFPMQREILVVEALQPNPSQIFASSP